MRKALALAACMVTVAAACGSSDDSGADTVATQPSAATEAPAATEPVATEPPATTPPATEPEPTTAPEPAPEPETTTTTEPPPELNVVGLVPLPGAQLDFSANSVDVPTLVWSAYSGSGGVIVENVGGPIPPGCHGVSFFDPDTFELLRIDDADLEAYATRGEGGCDNMTGGGEGVVDGPAVKVNTEDLIQFDFGDMPEPPFAISAQNLFPDGRNGIFLNSDPGDLVTVNDLTGATHVVGVSGVFEVLADGELSLLDPPAPTPSLGCDGPAVLCVGDRFGIEISDPSGNPASAIATGDSAGTFYFFGAHDTNILMSLVNGCAINNHFWVFAAANTDVEFDLTVTDTPTGEVRSYSHELGQSAEAILDTSAFATCP